MCDLESNVIRVDTRKVYYCEVDNCSNIYGIQLGICGAYGNKFSTFP